MIVVLKVYESVPFCGPKTHYCQRSLSVDMPGAHQDLYCGIHTTVNRTNSANSPEHFH